MCPKRARLEKRSDFRKDRGLALFITLTLMAIVVFLSVSLVNLSRTSIVAGSSSSSMVQARANAMMAMNLALIQLQETTGPDQRVTAKAGILSDTMQNPHWTGVWDTRTPSGNPVWLVSNSASPDEELSEGQFIRFGSVDDNIVVPLVRHSTGGESTPPDIGFAWWTSDEGVKHSLGTLDPTRDEDLLLNGWMNGVHPSIVRRLRQMVSPRADSNGIFGSGEKDVFGSSAWDQLKSLVSPNQIPIITSEIPSSPFSINHDTTTISYGILSNPMTGQLKEDLSLRPGLLGAAFEEYLNISDNLADGFNSLSANGLDVEDLRRVYRIKKGPPSGPGEISFDIAPVLTEFLISIAVIRRATTNDIEVRVRKHVELWNPYTSSLLPEDLSIRIYGLPTVTIERQDGGPSLTLDLQDRLNNSSDSDDPVEFLLPWNRSLFFPDHNLWKGGRVYNWVATHATATGISSLPFSLRFHDRTAPNSFGRLVFPDLIYASPVGTQMRLDIPSVSLVVELLDPSGNVVSTIENLEFDAAVSGFRNSNAATPQFGYVFRIIESGDMVEDTTLPDPQGFLHYSKMEWFRNNDPRASSHSLGGLDDQSTYFAPNGTDPTAYGDLSAPHRTARNSHLFDRVQGGTGLRPMEDVPLFELPRQSPVSIGELQHLRVSGLPPNAIGNSWANVNGLNLNSYFDRFFFSGLDSTPATSEVNKPFSNIRMRGFSASGLSRVQDLLNLEERSSFGILSVGRFNVNSNSVIAWENVLRGSNLTSPTSDSWGYVNKNDNNALPIGIANPTDPAALQAAFSRFSQSLEENYFLGAYRPLTSGDPPPPPVDHFRRGALSVADRSAELAEAIVQRITEKQRALGRPIFSMAEFLNSSPEFPHPFEYAHGNMSILERAIFDADGLVSNPEINRFVRDGSPESIYWLSPMYLTQADIMTQLSPILSTRSDTFRIFTYGEHIDKSSGEVSGRAWLEAVVQRVPEPYIQGDDWISPNPDGWGRKFKILSVRYF
jgi:hypothetical protein